jgi:hypothetical protein
MSQLTAILGFLFTLSCLSVPSFSAENMKSLNSRELKMAMQMNQMYASHMYSSSCMMQQKAQLLSTAMSEDAKIKQIQASQKACDCMSDEILKKVNPNDLIDYVTQTNGARYTGAGQNNRIIQLKGSQQFIQIIQTSRDKGIRRECGFSQ